MRGKPGKNNVPKQREKQQQQEGRKSVGFVPKKIKKSDSKKILNNFESNVNTGNNNNHLHQENNQILDCSNNFLLQTPEGRMEHIRSRIESIDLSPLKKRVVNHQATVHNNNSIQPNESEIDPNSICVVDNFLGSALISLMRKESESLVPKMTPSQSSKWDERSQTVLSYDKLNVLSTQIEGGSMESYQQTPRLIEYIVTVTSALSNCINRIVPPSYQLSTIHQTNKLAVCLGDGSYYDKHIDNSGGTDQRKLTALLYLQLPGSYNNTNERTSTTSQNVSTVLYANDTDDPKGGYFRAYDVPTIGTSTCIAPRSDRLVLFWSDALVHDVSPSYTTPNNSINDRRWALTVWFIVDPQKGGLIRETGNDVTIRHFSTS